MAGILSYFLPKDKVFYSLFEQASDNLEAIAKKLVQVVQEPDFGKRAVHISEMQDHHRECQLKRCRNQMKYLQYSLPITY